MAESLLAHLYTRIKGSQEDVATLALQYIISSSAKLNEAFNHYISNAIGVDIPLNTSYSCQSVGENKERPDMSGTDENGNELILCEMKFYAGLTTNQPNGYIERLKKENGKALVFICPEQRKVSLWNKISSECKESNDITDEDTYQLKAEGIVVAVLSWIEIIEELRRVSSSVAIEMQSDIDQLAGFCKMMDSSAFIPFTSNDFGSVVAQREERHYQVIDRLFDMIIANNSINTETKALRASANRNGYTRYIVLNNYSVALLYNRNAWMSNSYTETPFWFYFNDDEWNQSDELKDRLNSVPEIEKDIIDNKIVIALHPLCDVTLDEVADDMMNQIIYYMRDYLVI